jgi:hypothetical protein
VPVDNPGYLMLHLDDELDLTSVSDLVMAWRSFGGSTIRIDIARLNFIDVDGLTV